MYKIRLTHPHQPAFREEGVVLTDEAGNIGHCGIREWETMMRLTLTVFTSLMLGLAAFGYPALTGPSGLVATPTAWVTPTGGFTFAADYYFTQEAVGVVQDTIPLRVLYGIAPNTEVGIGGWISRAGGQDATALQANVKYLTPLHPLGANIAVGAIFAGSRATASPAFTDRAETWHLYLVGTHECLPGGDGRIGVTGTLGVNWTGIEAGAFDGSGFRGTAGVKVMLPNRLTIVAEAQAARSELGDAKPLTSIALRYPITEELKGEIGYTNASFAAAGLTHAEDHNIFAGLTYRWEGMR